MNNWISIYDKMPKEGEQVIAFCQHALSEKEADIKICRYLGKDRFDLWNGYRVTHWMPLPQPPKGE